MRGIVLTACLAIGLLMTNGPTHSAQDADEPIFIKDLSCHGGLFRIELPRTLSELRKLGSLLKDEHVDTLVWGDNSRTLVRKLQYEGLAIQLLSSPDEKTYAVESVVITSPRWSITPGFRVGETLAKVLNRLGIRQVVPRELIRFGGETDSVTLRVREGRVAEISFHCYTG